jgi:hypothetical protein
MKTTRISFIALMAAGLILAGCSKEGDSPSGTYPQDEAKAITDKDKQEFIDDMIDRLPNIAIYNQTMDQYLLVDWDQAKNGFNFASPSGGISFSGPDGTIEFVEGPSGGYYQVVSPSGSGGAAGGVVTAGPVALDITYVLCFNSGDGEEGLDLFEVGTGFSGFSGAVGIGGDFEALMMGEFDENSDPFEFLWGVVAYYAFDGTASGSYPIVNFFDAENETDSFLENKGLAYLISFQGQGGIFFSVDGDVTFSGNSVTFNGTYWGVTDVLIGFGDGFNPDQEPQYIEAPGFGTLTCQ